MISQSSLRRVLRILGRSLLGLLIVAPWKIIKWVGIAALSLLLTVPFAAGTGGDLYPFEVGGDLVDEPRWVLFRALVGTLAMALVPFCAAWWLVKAFARLGGFLPEEDCKLDTFLPPAVSDLRADKYEIARKHAPLCLWLNGHFSFVEMVRDVRQKTQDTKETP